MRRVAKAAEKEAARLERKRRRARLVLFFERLWPALWPPLGLIGLYAAAALFGFVSWLSPWLHLALLLALVVGVVLLGRASFSAVGWFPSRAAGDRRLEKANGLAHRPLAALADRPATPGVTAAALWQVHRARMAARLAHIRVGFPHPGLAARDRRALRVGLIVALVAGVGVAGADSLPRLAAAFTPAIPGGPAPPPPELAAWITPPAYTHLPPVFLKAPGGALSVPAGSGLAVSLTGGVGKPSLALAGAKIAFHNLGQASYRASATLTEGGRLTLRRGGRSLAAWDIAVVAPTAPIVHFGARPGADPESAATRIPWQVHDTYGVTALAAVLHLAARPGAAAVRIGIPLADADPRNAAGAALVDLTASPWAGLDVDAELIGRNGAGLTGTSETLRFRLPEIAFRNPLARALISVRKQLVLDPDNRERAIAGLDALSATPPARNGDLGGFLNMRAIAGLLTHDRAPTAVDRAESRLWELAWHYEGGPSARTAQELAAATRALQQALAEAGRKDGPSAKEIDRRIRALEEAIRRQIAALAKSLTANGAKLPDMSALKQFDQQALERMAEAMRRAVAAGDLDTARREMAELQQLLRQLQNARPLNAEDVARAERMQQGEQAMAALGDVLQRESGLLDHAQSRFAQGQGKHDGVPSAGEDQATQQALRRVLGVLMSNLADATGQIPSALGKADIDMRKAAQALGAGAEGSAAAAEQQAIADLQKGGRQAMAAMAASRAGEHGRGAGEAGLPMQAGPSADNPMSGRFGRAPGIGLDPLGRPTGDQSDGGRSNGYVAIPDRDVAAEARAIQEELRRRDANPSLPAPDREYINRLLKEF